MVPNRTPNRTPSRLTRIWLTTNAPDYVGLTVLIISYALIIIFITPFHRLFYTKDPTISFPHAQKERVSVSYNILYAALLPLALQLAINTLTKASKVKHEATYLPFFISLALSSFLTDVIKNAVGRPRPDLLARCIPDVTAPGDRPVDISVCTAPDGHVLQDGWRSFPSGHSSFSFAGLGFTALFLAGQLSAFSNGKRDLSRALVCLVPILGATLIAVSRCEDYRHDVYDVCVGSVLGMSVAWWSYRRYWPRLASARCDEPCAFPGGEGWTRVRDEEEGDNVGGFEMGVLREGC